MAKAPKPIETIDLRKRAEWRKWLKKNHSTQKEIWLVFHKKHTGVECICYEQAVEEAICFGWIDSLMRRLDEDRYARKFTPRKRNSRWSSANRKRYAALESAGLLEEAGLEYAPTDRDGDAPRSSTTKFPQYISAALEANPSASHFFQQLAPSYKRAYVGWIDSAKREATREKRLREAIELLAAGKKLGMK